MRGLSSLRKGQAAERAVMHMFQDKFGGHWERRPLGIPGPDIFSPSWFPYSIEVKCIKEIKVAHLFGREKPTAMLRDCWNQAVGEAKILEKAPLLVIKSQRQWFITEDLKEWMKLKEWFELKEIERP